MNVEDIARVCHQVNKSFCISIGDNSQLDWENTYPWARESAVNGVKFHLENPEATPENSHESWMKEKIESGWVYGDVKDVEKKTHPCLLPYSELPLEQRAKDYLFKSVVESLRSHLS